MVLWPGTRNSDFRALYTVWSVMDYSPIACGGMQETWIRHPPVDPVEVVIISNLNGCD